MNETVINTYMWKEVQEGISTQGPHSQCHKETQKKFEKYSIHQWYQYNTQQGKKADDGDGYKATNPSWQNKKIKKKN